MVLLGPRCRWVLGAGAGAGFGRAGMIMVVVVVVGHWCGKGVHRVAALIWRELVSGGLRM